MTSAFVSGCDRRNRCKRATSQNSKTCITDGAQAAAVPVSRLLTARRDRLDDAVQDGAHLVAGGGGVGRAGYEQRGLAERAEQDARQGHTGLWRDAAELNAAGDEALGLTDVTLAGNDTGGALCQFVIDTDSSRIGRLVLTNCDAFDQFPPPLVWPMVKLGSSPFRLRLMTAPMRWAAVRHSPLGYGPFATAAS